MINTGDLTVVGRLAAYSVDHERKDTPISQEYNSLQQFTMHLYTLKYILIQSNTIQYIQVHSNTFLDMLVHLTIYILIS